MSLITNHWQTIASKPRFFPSSLRFNSVCYYDHFCSKTLILIRSNYLQRRILIASLGSRITHQWQNCVLHSSTACTDTSRQTQKIDRVNAQLLNLYNSRTLDGFVVIIILDHIIYKCCFIFIRRLIRYTSRNTNLLATWHIANCDVVFNKFRYSAKKNIFYFSKIYSVG